MADKNDVVIIDLDRPRVLWFGHKALKKLTAMTGKSIEDLGEDEEGKMDLEEIEKIMYCGLLSDAQKNNETLTLEDMEDLLDVTTYSNIMDKMMAALNASFGGMADFKPKN